MGFWYFYEIDNGKCGVSEMDNRMVSASEMDNRMVQWDEGWCEVHKSSYNTLTWSKGHWFWVITLRTSQISVSYSLNPVFKAK